MTDPKLTLTVLPWTFAVCRLAATDPVPAWALEGKFFSITRTPQELSLVCLQENVPGGVVSENGWRAFQIMGVFDFSLIGILYSILRPLTEAHISIFAVSTYDTDYILVKENRLEFAFRALTEAGFPVSK
jgi:uncharacterized protein